MFNSIFKEIKFLISLKKKAFYIGWHGYGNLGDEALLASCEQLLGKHLSIYEKKYFGKGVKFILKSKFDVLLLGGGTLINDECYLKELKSIEARKKIVFGTGVSDPVFWYGTKGYNSCREEWVEELNKVDFLGVRGPLSKGILDDWGVKNVKIIGDPVLLFARNYASIKPKKKILGVNVGYARNILWGSNEEDFYDKYIAILKHLGEKGWSFMFFPVSNVDLDITKKFISALKPFHATCIDNLASTKTYMENLDSVDVFIGEKLHSVILSICSITPSIMLEYRPKCLDFMMSLGLEHLNFKTDKLYKLDEIANAIEVLYENIDSEQADLLGKTKKMKNTLMLESENILALTHF